jgi:MoxR-like ATPase
METGTAVPPGVAFRALEAEIAKVIRGQAAVIEQMVVTMLCKGHALLEGVPGTAKTLMVRTLARLVSAQFRRIQFTPDLMPSDIVGTNVFDLQHNAFRLRKGPIFTDLLLADEINRTPAKTQAALLEAMQERQVTIDGQTESLGDLFTVFATQNPLEYEGTYRLPEAQLDRFLMKIQVDYPTAEDEDKILQAYDAGQELHELKDSAPPVLKPENLRALRAGVIRTKVEPALLKYIREIVWATRSSDSILVGCGPRASIHLLYAAKALAPLRDRDFVTPDDIQEMAFPVMRHRVVLQPEAEVEGLTADEALRQVIKTVKVPR